MSTRSNLPRSARKLLDQAKLPTPLPRHKFQLPAEPVYLAQEKKDSASSASAVPDQELITGAAGKARYLSNPVYFGFMTSMGVALALACFFFILNVGALAGWLTGALFIGLGLDPIVRKLEAKGLSRGASVGTIFAGLAAILAAIILWVVPVLAKQAVSFINGFPAQFNEFLNSDFFNSLDARFNIRSSVENEVNNFFSQLTSHTSVVSSFFNSLVNAGSTIAQIGTGLIIVLFLSIYVVSSLPTIKAWGIRLAPASKREQVGYLTEKITSSVGQYVMGQALVALLNGSAALIIMLVAGVPFAQLLMLFVVMLAFIPLVGGVSAAALVSLIALIDSWQTALFFLIPYLIYLQIEAYFVSPRIMSRAVAVPGAVAIIAVIAGSSLWGVLGALIAIPIAASLLILVNEVLVPRQDRR